MVKLAVRGISQKRYGSHSDAVEPGQAPAVVLFAAGVGTRRSRMLSMLRPPTGSRLVAVCTGHPDPGRKPYKRKHVEEMRCAEACDAVLATPRDDDGVAHVFIDVSCLPRQHIGALFASVKRLACKGPVDLQMAYSLARFVTPPQHWSSTIRSFAPVHDEFAGWTAMPENPIELVIGLGYERGKALGAAEFLEPRDTWLFVPDSPEERYLKEVRAQNSELMQDREDKQIIYGVLQPVDAFHMLLSLVRGIRQVARPILLPFGPKILFGLSLLVAMIFEEAAVWFVDGEDTSATDSGKPSQHSVVLTCRIEPGDAPAEPAAAI